MEKKSAHPPSQPIFVSFSRWPRMSMKNELLRRHFLASFARFFVLANPFPPWFFGQQQKSRWKKEKNERKIQFFYANPTRWSGLRESADGGNRRAVECRRCCIQPNARFFSHFPAADIGAVKNYKNWIFTVRRLRKNAKQKFPFPRSQTRQQAFNNFS